MKKNIYLILICSFYSLYTNASNLKYESIEHLYLGKNVYLKYLDQKGNIIKKSGEEAMVKTVYDGIKNIDLSFAELIYLSGDFITDPTTKTFHEATPSDYETIFTQNFNMYDKTFKGNYKGATTSLVGSFIPKIQEIINKEQEDNQRAINEHKPIVINSKDNLKLNCATGGVCSKEKDFLNKKGLYAVASVEKGSDHFGNNAIINYLTGHKLAIRTALEANGNINELNKAYAYEGYAQHFLTDIFAAGHMRTPIDELASLPHEKTLDTIIIYLVNLLGITERDIHLAFAKAMHDEDNTNGLYVRTNYNKSPWLAFGDSHLFINENISNLKNTILAMQKAVDQVFDAYQNKQKFNKHEQELYLLQKETEIKDYMPDLNFVKSPQSLNPNPKYAVINGYLYEPSSRDWSNGSKGSICGLGEIIDQIMEPSSTRDIIISIIKQYCYTTIHGFAKTKNWLNSNLKVKIIDKDNLVITNNKGVEDAVSVNFYNDKTHSLQEFYATPIVTDSNITCTFKYPIKIMRYGTYTSLDEKGGNNFGHYGVYLSKEYVDCKNSHGQSRNDIIVYYQASSVNKNQYFGLSKGNGSYNATLCTDIINNIQYITNNSNNTCEIWH